MPSAGVEKGQKIRLANKFGAAKRSFVRRNKLGSEIGNSELGGRTTAGAATSAGDAGAAAAPAAVYQVRKRLVKVNAAIAHVPANLFGLGKGVGDVTRLAGGASLQHKRRSAGHHGSTERS